MNSTETRRLGKTGVKLTQLGFGGAPLGELFVRVDEAASAATLVPPGTRDPLFRYGALLWPGD